MHVSFKLNGMLLELDVPPREMLSESLKFRCGINSVKIGCGVGECGTCTVWLNGEPVRSCLFLTCRLSEADEVVTVEGLKDDHVANVLKRSFMNCYGFQCGYCTPGILLVSTWLLKKNPKPREDDIKEALVGNLCRCTGYQQIVEAIRKAAEQLML